MQVSRASPFPLGFAALQSIRLSLNVGDSTNAREFHVPPCAVARSAKVDCIRGTEVSGIENRQRTRVEIARSLGEFHSADVLGCRTMTGFTGHAGNEILLIRLSH